MPIPGLGRGRAEPGRSARLAVLARIAGLSAAMLAALLAIGPGPALAFRPSSAQAQTGGWQESASERYAIVYHEDAAPAAGYYATQADGLYDALAAAFDAQLETPLTLKLFGSDEDFLAANPLFVESGGVLAQARRGRRELAISLPRALGADAALAAIDPSQPQPALDNALRYELAHLFAARISGDRLPAGFRAGVAAYMTSVDERRAASVARLREAHQEGQLLSWSALNAPGAEYLDPPLSQPQSLSIVHYLVELQGFARLMDFLRASAGASGWRGALEQSYGQQPSRLAADWEAWLPSYLDGGWRRHALYSGDLGAASALMRRGDFQGAAAQLGGAISLLERGDPVLAEAARVLLADAEAGLAARDSTSDAAAALQAGRYAEALSTARSAAAVLVRLGDAAGAEYAGALADRAGMGVDAEAALRRAEALPAWRAAEARAAGNSALQNFARIGNDAAAERARTRVERLDRRQAPLAWALLALGLGLIVWSARKRRAEARSGGTGWPGPGRAAEAAEAGGRRGAAA